MSWTTVAAVALLSLAGEQPGASTGLPLSPEAQGAVQRALEAMKTPYSALPQQQSQAEERLYAAAAEFRAALDELFNRLAADQLERLRAVEGEDLRAKLAVIAWDRRERIDLYELIEDTYVRMRRDPGGGQIKPPPPLVADHVTETFRLVWEHYLLTPMPEGASPMYVPRVMHALSVIHHDASVLALVHCFELSCTAGMPPKEVPGLQRRILHTLDQFRTAAAARGLLSCAERAAARGTASGGDAAWNVENYVYGRFVDESAATAGWHPILRSLDRSGLTDRQKALLDRALAANP